MYQEWFKEYEKIKTDKIKKKNEKCNLQIFYKYAIISTGLLHERKFCVDRMQGRASYRNVASFLKS